MKPLASLLIRTLIPLDEGPNQMLSFQFNHLFKDLQIQLHGGRLRFQGVNLENTIQTILVAISLIIKIALFILIFFIKNLFFILLSFLFDVSIYFCVGMEPRASRVRHVAFYL
jgi:hypothetical protein